jgi:hypothetical protein
MEDTLNESNDTSAATKVGIYRKGRKPMAIRDKVSRPGNKGTGSGQSKIKMNVPVIMTKEVYRADPSLPTPAEDYLFGTLLVDAFGKKAGEEVRVKIDVGAPKRKANYERAATDQDGEKKRLLEIVDMEFGVKKGGAVMKQNPTIILEKATFDARTQFVVAEFLNVGTHSDTHSNERVLAGVMGTVDEVRTSQKTNKPYQNRYFYDRDNARPVTWSEPAAAYDSISAAVGQALEEAANSGFSRPFVLLQLVNRKPQENAFGYDAITFRVPIAYDADNKVSKSAQESLVEFYTALALEDGKTIDLYIPEIDDQGNEIEGKSKLAYNDDGSVAKVLRHQYALSIIDAACKEIEEGVSDYFVQVMPGYTIPTGGDSMPSNKLGDAYSFYGPIEDDETGEIKDKDTRYLAECSMSLGRVMKEERTGVTLGPWFAKKTFTTYAFDARLFKEHEIITDHTPAEIAEIFRANAERRYLDKKAEYEAHKKTADASSSREIRETNQQPKASSYSGSDDIHEEEPDDLSNGFGPGGR